MKRIRKSRAARILTWLLTATMVAPVFLGMLTPVTGYAQNATPAGGVQTVIVLDFENRTSDPLGAVLARQATDATAVELANTARYEVLKRDEVIRTSKELGLKPPLDQVAKTKLATSLGATAIIEGAVKFVKQNTKNGPRSVSVGLTIRVGDASTGDLISGAAQIGEARARAGQSDPDSLAQEAVGNAAVLGVRQINTYNLPEGTIVNTVGTQHLQILVNRGSRDGVSEGMQMIVTRDRQRVGRIRVTNVFPTDCECEPVENTLGIAPSDKVRAVFPMPDFTVRGELVQKTTRTNPTRSVSALGKILLVLLVGVVIATAAKGGTSTVTGVLAEPDTQNNGPAVRLNWRDTIFGSGTQTLEYHVWRIPEATFNFQGIPVAAISGGSHTYTDLPFPYTYWDGVNSYLQPQFATGNGGGGNANQNTVQVVTPAAGSVTGFRQAGTSYIYQITAIIRRPVFQAQTGTGGGGGLGGGGGGLGGGGGGLGGGGGGGGLGGGGGGGGNGGQGGGTEDIETGTVNSGQATPLARPVIQSPADQSQNIALGAVNYSFQSVLGGDEFEIQVTTDRTFTNKNLIVSLTGFSSAPDASGVPQSLVSDLSNNPILRRDPVYNNFVNRVPGAPRPVLFFRVGFRNSGDKPGPVNALTRVPSDSDRVFRFVYSQIRSFSPADLPPPPP